MILMFNADLGEVQSKRKQRTIGHKAHQSSSFKLPSPAFRTGMIINAC